LLVADSIDARCADKPQSVNVTDVASNAQPSDAPRFSKISAATSCPRQIDYEPVLPMAFGIPWDALPQLQDQYLARYRGHGKSHLAAADAWSPEAQEEKVRSGTQQRSLAKSTTARQIERIS
jgi:hypothetical protein